MERVEIDIGTRSIEGLLSCLRTLKSKHCREMRDYMMPEAAAELEVLAFHYTKNGTWVTVWLGEKRRSKHDLEYRIIQEGESHEEVRGNLGED
jgi:hypothetical protein